MNFIQKKRKDDAATKHIVALQLMRGPLMQPLRRSTPGTESGSNESGARSMPSIAAAATTVFNNSSAYVGLTSGRGHAQSEVGIAWTDIESPSITLVQMSDDHWYSGLLNKLNIIQPAQIVVPQTVFDAKPETADGKLLKYMREQFPSFAVIKIPRRNFSDTDGIELINKYCSKKFSHAIQSISSKYYALSAAAGLLKYLLHSVHVSFRENSLKLEFDTKYGHLLMDVETTYTLELVNGSGRNHMKTTHSSLYDILDQCVTSIGKRTLRAKILEPSCDVPHIQLHQRCITELNSDEHTELKSLLAGILRQFNYVERLHKLALVVPQDDNIRAAEVLINQTIQLRTCLQLVPVLRNKLKPLQSLMIQDIFNALSDERYQLMLETIDTVLNKDLIVWRNEGSIQLTQRIHCIQAGKCAIVDMLRKIYTELTDELENYVTNLSARCGQAFKMHYDAIHGYHVRLMVANDTTVNDFPPEFNVLSLKRNLCALTTTEISKLNIRLKCVIEEITMQSNVVLAFMLTDIVAEIDAIYDLSGFVATLDNLVSLASISARDDYVCPTFTDEIRIVDAIHPLLEKNVRNAIAVPNNVIATPDYNFYIITGPNMGGKTVYLKMIAVLQIMAQLGSYVPAKSAELRVTDRIFTRIGSNDSIEKNASSFVLEVNVTEHILKNVTANSLVIIDELYRSTNPKEGLQLAWSFCEQLISIRGKAMRGEFFVESFGADNDGKSTVTSNSRITKIDEVTGPFVYLTTHYHNLTKLADWYFNVVNLSFNADEISSGDEPTHLQYTHRIQEGVAAVDSYGLRLAESVRFPPSIVPKAKLIYRDLKEREERENVIIQRNGQRKCSKLAKSLAALRISELNTGQSVVSAAMADKRSDSRRNNSALSRHRTIAASSRFSARTSDQSGDQDANDSAFLIDKVLYNLYGDIASAVRNCAMNVEDADLSYCSSINRSDSGNLRQRRNDAIVECLKVFVSTESNIFIEAVIDGLRDSAADLITLPTESSPPQTISKCNSRFEDVESFAPSSSHVADRGDQQPPSSPPQQSQSFSTFAAPSNADTVPPQLLVVPSSQIKFSQMPYRTPSIGYATPDNSEFEFFACPSVASIPMHNEAWTNGFDGASFQPFRQHSNSRCDGLDFVSQQSATSVSLPRSTTASNNGDTASQRHSLFSVSTLINPHLGFGSARASRSAANSDHGESRSGVYRNNSENKYAKPFKSIRTDSKLRKSNSQHGQIGDPNPSTISFSATCERVTDAATPSVIGLNSQYPSTANDSYRQTQSKQCSEKRKKISEFKAKLKKFYESEKFQQMHRFANRARIASASKTATATSASPLNESDKNAISASSIVVECNTVVGRATDATSTDALSAPISPLPDASVLPPPPGFS